MARVPAKALTAIPGKWQAEVPEWCSVAPRILTLDFLQMRHSRTLLPRFIQTFHCTEFRRGNPGDLKRQHPVAK